MWRDPLDELIERLDNGLSTALPGDGCRSLPSFVELQWAVSRILDGIRPSGRRSRRTRGFGRSRPGVASVRRTARSAVVD